MALSKGTKIGITVGVIAILTAAGIIVYKKVKKKKESAAAKTGSEAESESTTPAVSNGVVWTGLNETQTRTLQTKLNDFISSGKLGMVLGWLGLGGWWSDMYDSVTNYVTNMFYPGTELANSSNALAVMKTSIAPNLTNGSLFVDGKYGNNTKAVVAALQVYLNTTKGTKLTVDGKYGKNTDAATGWHICS